MAEQNMKFYSFEFDPMTLILKIDLNMVYLYAEILKMKFLAVWML